MPLDAVQCDGDVGQQDGGIVVVGVGGDPAHPRRRAFRPLGQQGRLAVPRRGDDRDHRRRAFGDEPLDQVGPGHDPWPGHRRMELRVRQVERELGRRSIDAFEVARRTAADLRCHAFDRTLPCQFVPERYSVGAQAPHRRTPDRLTTLGPTLAEEAGLQVADDVVDRAPADHERPSPRRAEREEQGQAQADDDREADDQERGPWRRCGRRGHRRWRPTPPHRRPG